MKKLTYRRTHGSGYEILADGEKIGEVEQREERYNLRRVYVARWWQITGVPGFNDGAVTTNKHHHFDTRRAAVAALLDYMEKRA